MDEDSSDDDVDDSQPLPPEEMFLSPEEYSKTQKIPNRCQVTSTVEHVERKFPEELKWFQSHRQFQHVFHMPREPNHMLQGMLMLLVRTVKTQLKEECWFVVNGVPVRYSMKEHALLTGFACHEYPEDWKNLGSDKFAKRVFKKVKGVKIVDVVKKLDTMKKHSPDRMKLVVLLFLCKVIKAKVKADGPIEEFLLQIIDDLSVCETFPWGRYTFNDTIEGIRSIVTKLNKGERPKSPPAFPGFIIPLEILAFESIPCLGRKFREAHPANKNCPRMCKHKFIKDLMKGFTLDILNDTLGRTKEICSILEPDSDEKTLLASIVGDDVDEGMGYIDIVVDGWRERLIEQKEKIWWKGMYKKDVASRTKKKEDIAIEDVSGGVTNLREVMEKGFQRLVDQVGEIDEKVDARLAELDRKVSDLHQVVLAHAKAFYGEPDSPKIFYGQVYSGDKDNDDSMALTPYSRVEVSDPNPPSIVEVSEEQEKTTEKSVKKKREGKEKENKKKNEKEKEKKKDDKEKEKETEKEKKKDDKEKEKEKKKEKEKEKKKEKDKEKGTKRKMNAEKEGLLIKTGEKRNRVAPDKYTPAGKSSK